jgi:hypothetical protein
MRMRSSLPLLVMTVWTLAPVARAQTAARLPATSRPTAMEPPGDRSIAAPPAAAAPRKTSLAHDSRRSPSRHSRSPGAGAAKRRPVAGRSDGVLTLGATDITGNKELPKVMVIVPWKDSLGASGALKPTDSLMDEVLGPVDRGVFQRQIRYYGQLNAIAARPAAGTVAPSGDTR